MIEEHWDFIVIGAGSAGCAVAAELADIPGQRTLVLEAGPSDARLAVKFPLGAAIFDLQSLDWGYFSAPDPTRSDRFEHWTRGRVVGGSSSINGMNYVRGSRADFDAWHDMGLRGWHSNDVWPVFKENERCDSRSITPSASRGWVGGLHVRSVRHLHATTRAFLEAAQKTGHSFNSDYNDDVQEGVAHAQVNQMGRRRWSAADAFLRPALRHGKGVTLRTLAQVQKLLFAGKSIRGVVYAQDGRIHQVRARHVVLCAGAINTPQLLMLSGIGPAADLRRFGIPVLLDRAAVGAHLLEHPLIRMIYGVNVPTYNGGAWAKARMLARYLTGCAGPMAAVYESLAFLRTSMHEPQPDIQIHMAPIGFDVQTEGTDALVRVLSAPSLTILVNKNRPLSHGFIRLRSAAPEAPPLIESHLLGHSDDVVTLRKGIELVRRIASTAPLSTMITGEIKPGLSITRENAEDYIRSHVELGYHPAGTCRMGTDADAVVDAQLSVRAIDNLWIADASIMPELISGNINAVCMMIGRKLGRSLRERRV